MSDVVESLNASANLEVGAIYPAGPANELSIGTVEEGEAAKATITGASPKQVLNLVLPKPQKGSDYFTEEEKQEMINEVSEGATSEFNKNVNEKIDIVNVAVEVATKQAETAETYANEAKNTAENIVTEETIRQENEILREAERAGYKEIISDLMKDMSVSNTVININDSANFDAELTLDGKAEQVQTTQGSNIADVNVLYEEMKAFDSTDLTETTVDNKNCIKFYNTRYRKASGFNGLANINYKENTTYTVRGLFRVNDTALTSGYSLSMTVYYTDGTYDSATTVAAGEAWQELRIVTNAEKTVSFISFSYGSGALWLLDKDNFGIYEGDVTEYTAFVPNSPSPSYPAPISAVEGTVEVRSTSKNILPRSFGQELLDRLDIPSTNTNNCITEINGNTYFKYHCDLGYGTGLQYFIKDVFKENTQYLFKLTLMKNNSATNSSLNITFRYTDGSYKAHNAGNFWANMTEKEVELISESGKTLSEIRINYASGITYINLDKYILCKYVEGETVEYEPCQVDTKTIDLQGNFMAKLPSGVKDTLNIDKNANIKLLKNVYRVVAGNNLSVSKNTSYGYFEVVLTNKSTSYAAFISNLFANPSARIGTSGNLWIFYTDTEFAEYTATEMKQWLIDNAFELYYKLSEPYEIDLGKLETPLKTFRTITNISNSANTNMVLNYKKDLQTQLAEFEALLSVNATNEEVTE